MKHVLGGQTLLAGGGGESNSVSPPGGGDGDPLWLEAARGARQRLPEEVQWDAREPPHVTAGGVWRGGG